MKKSIFFSLLIAVLVGFVACDKETTTTPETVAVTVNSPSEGAMFHSGNQLNINVTFTDPTELHNYSVVITNTTATMEVFNVSGHKHSTTHTVDSTITLNVTGHSDFKLVATGTNHSGETDTKEVNFHVHP